MKKTKERDEQFYLEPVKKITRVAINKYSKDELYKEYLNLFEIVNILQDSYTKILKSEFKEAADNAKLKDKIEALEEELELYKGISEMEKKEKDEYLRKYLDLKESKVKNERGAGRKNKFDKVQVEQIKQLRGQGESIRSIATKFDCSIGLIHKIINEQYPKDKDNKSKQKDKGWYNDDIDTLRRKVELREKTIKEFGFIEEGGTYKEWEQMKARLKELEEAERVEK